MRVDDARSRQGGRELWGVPKELAVFDYTYANSNRTLSASCHEPDGQLLASGDFHSILGTPSWLRLPVPFPNLQILHDEPYRSTGTFWSVLKLCSGGTVIPADSPLAALGIAGRKPVVSFAGLDFKMHLEAAHPLK